MNAKVRVGMLLVAVAVVAVGSSMALTQPPVGSPQETKKQDAPKPTGPPAYFLAVRKARSISDPTKKLEELERIQAQFPAPEAQAMVAGEKFRTIVKNWPDQTERILAEAGRYTASKDPESAAGSAENVAATLFEARILTDEAERFATRSIAMWEKAFEAKKDEAKDPNDGMTDEDRQIIANFTLIARARSFGTLAMILHSKGRDSEAKKLFKQAVAGDPSMASAIVGLADIAEKSGDDTTALGYYVDAALAGGMKPESRKRLEAVYQKTHSGSLEGLEEMIDAKYVARNPLPIKVDAYKPTPARSDRVVLAEIFTGAACGPCVGLDLAFDAAMERYSRRDVVVLMYHQHIPRPDPMTNPSTIARGMFYGLSGVPLAVIDGKKDQGGGGPRENAARVYNRINPELEERLRTAAEARLTLEAEFNGPAIKVKASVDKTKRESPQLKLNIVLVESRLRYTGENGIRFHPMVVRSLASFPIDPSKPTSVEHTFDMAKVTADLKAHLDDYEVNGSYGRITFAEKKHALTPKNLAVVAFVQDEQTKKVLQAGYVNPK